MDGVNRKVRPYPAPKRCDMEAALNGDQGSVLKLYRHYEELIQSQIWQTVCQFSSMSGIPTDRYPQEDMRQEMYLKLSKAIRNFSL